MVHISIREVSKRFGRQTVLDRVSLEIEAGELFFLLGPSGCGKTTLLRHVAGFYQPDEGRIFFDEDDVTRLPVHKRDTGMMFQSYALWPHLNVAQNVAFGLEERRRPQAEIEHRVNEALELVQLGGLGVRRIAQLSGGQQQRVALARALAPNPRVLLMDEPFAALDAMTREQLYSDLQKICQARQKTVIFVTHNVREAVCLGNRVVLFSPNPGRIREEFKVDLPRPRDINDPALAGLAGEITRALKGHTSHQVAE